MKNKWFYCALLLSALWSCSADVDMDNIDKTMQMQTSISAPLVTAKIMLSDIFSDSEDLQTDEDGLYYIEKKFSSTKKITFELQDKIESYNEALSGGSQEGENTSFPIEIPLKNINNGSSDALRVDKAELEELVFEFKINGISGENVSITIKFDENQFKGLTNNIYPLDFENGVATVSLENFTLNLMKNENSTPASNNVYDKLYMTLNISGTVTGGITMNIETKSAEYKTIYGKMFDAGDDVTKSSFTVKEIGLSFEDVKELVLPFAEPTINLKTKTSFSAPIVLNIKSLYLIDERDNKHSAMFGGSTEFAWSLEGVTELPVRDVENDLTLTKEQDKGTLADCFEEIPVSMKCEYSVGIDAKQNMPQWCLTKESAVECTGNCYLPFAFNAGAKIVYEGEKKMDIFGSGSTDFDSTKINSLFFYVTIKNSLPFPISGTMKLINKDGTVSKIKLFKNDEFTAKSPEIEANGTVKTPVSNTETVELEKISFDDLKAIKKVKYSITLGKNEKYVKMFDSNYLSITIGLSTNVDIQKEL